MAEESTVTNDGAGTAPATTPTEPTTPAQPATPAEPTGEGNGQPAGNPPAEPQPSEGNDGEGQGTEPTTSVGDSFTISDIEWPDELGLDDAAKTELFDTQKDLFKGKAEVNVYLKRLAEATKINKENQAKKVKELEAKWETALKTDSEFGKDYEGNKKLVVDTAKKFSSEADFAEMEKFGFTKSPAFNRMMQKIAKEFEGAKVVKTGQPSTPSTTKTDSYGRTMFDFSKKQ